MGADFSYAQLVGTDLRYARLAGADLRGAQLMGADMRDAQAPGVISSSKTSLGLADFRSICFAPATDADKAEISDAIAAIPDPGLRETAKRRLNHVLNDPTSNWTFSFTASEQQPLFAFDPVDQALASHREWILTEPRAPYPSALADLLATGVATQGDAAASAVASRSISYLESSVAADHVIGLAIACQLLDSAGIHLTPDSSQALPERLSQQHRKCPKPVPEAQ
jgi:Pentapeptide repeats (8 copies)